MQEVQLLSGGGAPSLLRGVPPFPIVFPISSPEPTGRGRKRPEALARSAARSPLLSLWLPLILCEFGGQAVRLEKPGQELSKPSRSSAPAPLRTELTLSDLDSYQIERTCFNALRPHPVPHDALGLGLHGLVRELRVALRRRDRRMLGVQSYLPCSHTQQSLGETSLNSSLVTKYKRPPRTIRLPMSLCL